MLILEGMVEMMQPTETERWLNDDPELVDQITRVITDPTTRVKRGRPRRRT